MAADPFFKNKKVGIIEPLIKNQNDRTWSFWEEGEGLFEQIVKKKWPNLNFYSQDGKIPLDTGSFNYKMIQGIDFYNFCLARINKASHIELIQDQVLHVSENSGAVVNGEKGEYSADLVFKSYMSADVSLDHHLSVIQHFGGWFVNFDESVFDAQTATFMDFRIEQAGESRFFYVLPLSEKEALVEMAIFSNSPWTNSQYDEAIHSYIDKYISKAAYVIQEREYGKIPMTTYPFWKHDSNYILHIGTAGGAVKPSSGYAFTRIQKHSDLIIDQIKTLGKVSSSKAIFKKKFYYYDATLLHVLLEQKKSCAKVFAQMFKRNKGDSVLSFLNEDTSYLNEIKMFSTMPILPFSKGLLRTLF